MNGIGGPWVKKMRTTVLNNCLHLKYLFMFGKYFRINH